MTTSRITLPPKAGGGGPASDPPPMAQVLTRNVIQPLTQDLDASDVLECYTLVRSAPLHGIANSTIHIHKTAIGIRYRPTGAAALAHQQLHSNKRPMELTLEYGPQRLGPSLNHEAVPYIQVSEQESSFIGWENEAKIFYTTKIVAESYVSSYYMASMTGAVLSKILVQAVEYAERRRRYQPFAVYSVEKGREVRSSSSIDFAHYIWQKLANLGVEIKPILPPPIYEARIWVDSLEKVVPEPSIAKEAATFYQKLYQCIESIATNDYSAYQPTMNPTTSPQPTSSPSMTAEPTVHSSSSTHGIHEHDRSNATVAPTLSTTVEGTDGDTTVDNDGSNRGNHIRRRLDDTDDTDFDDQDLVNDKDDNDDLVFGDDENTDQDDDNVLAQPTPAPVRSSSTVSPVTHPPTIAQPADGPTSAPVRSSSTVSPATHPPTIAPPADVTPEKEVEKVKKAAAEAQQAANEAKNAAQTVGENKAADAAQAAATAAQVAAEATSNAAGQAAMEGLLSGDGSTMASIVSQCLTNEQYDIVSTTVNGTITVKAILYCDSSTYYKLNLASPYLEIAKINRPLPKAVNSSQIGSGGDPIDFVLAIVVLCCVLLVFVAILQQIGYKFFHSFYNCQQWFFNPRNHEYDDETLEFDESLFSLSEDGIPLSMGGRLARISNFRARSPPLKKRERLSAPDVRTPDFSHKSNSAKKTAINRSMSNVGGTPGEVEMSTLARRRSPQPDDGSEGTVSDEELDVASAIVPQRLMRDPDLVDMPHLKSTSKVAIPVGANTNGNGDSAHSRSYDIGYEEKEYSF